jgi:hypothetical protein
MEFIIPILKYQEPRDDQAWASMIGVGTKQVTDLDCIQRNSWTTCTTSACRVWGLSILPGFKILPLFLIPTFY